MPSFSPGGSVSTPFGVNEFLRSTNDVKYEHYTCAASTVPSQTIDGVAGQKILQRGVIMAKITSGPELGKIGPYCGTAGTKEVQTLTKGGTVSGGTFTLSFGGEVTGDIAYDAVAADVADELNALDTVAAVGGVTVTGGPLNTGAFSVTFQSAGDKAMIVSDVTNLTGAGAAVTVAEGTKGVAGAVDGRATSGNIVGINDTFLPWQLIHRDVEVAVVYEASIVDGRLYELNDADQFVAATSTTMTILKTGTAVYEFRVK